MVFQAIQVVLGGAEESRKTLTMIATQTIPDLPWEKMTANAVSIVLLIGMNLIWAYMVLKLLINKKPPNS